ncbi:tyrosine-type recombinase/integrase [Myxococcus sp. XM-1-1-1]|uniref:tyrosine-type recombinase/integrase n=1 Tax=Myxococcus sp. XM-1-1-1 TaxID=2874602 RepID=UPI00351D7200
MLNTVFKAALRWGVIEQMPATIELLKVAPSTMEFYEPHEFERLVDAAAKVDHQHLVFILLGGEAGLRCGEIIALEQTDVDFIRGVIHVRRSEWEGHVTLPKGGRARQVNMTARLADAVRKQRHLRGERILWRADGHPKGDPGTAEQVDEPHPAAGRTEGDGASTSSATPSAPGWQWRALRRRPSRSWPGTRTSPPPSGTCI